MFTALQERLENKDCGETVNGFAPLLDAHLTLAQNPVGFDTGEALIPHVHGEGELFVKHFGELAGFLGGSAVGTAQAQRQAYDDLADLVVFENFFEQGEVGALILAEQCGQALRGDS